MVQTNRLIRMQALACMRDYPYYIEISFVTVNQFVSLYDHQFVSLYDHQLITQNILALEDEMSYDHQLITQNILALEDEMSYDHQLITQNILALEDEMSYILFSEKPPELEF